MTQLAVAIVQTGGVTTALSALAAADAALHRESGDAVFAEKVREDHIRGWGFEVVRLTWSDLRNPARVARLIEAAVHRAWHARRSRRIPDPQCPVALGPRQCTLPTTFGGHRAARWAQQSGVTPQ